MSALSTPGGGGTTAQSKPTSGKQKYQKLDINSLYCANRNENSEPSSVKSQLSRKHGMQSLGKVPSARRPPANLPSLKTETGQDPNANSISTTSTTVSTAASCTSQTTTTISSSSVLAGSSAGGWGSLPPPSSPHFRSEFPSLDASAHRAADHTQPQLSLRPQTEGSWTSGGTAGSRPDPPPTAPTSHTPAYPTILPPFLMKGSAGSGLGLGGLAAAREVRETRAGRPARPAPPRCDVLTARPILRDEQINSLDDIARDAGWAQNDDIDYDQKLDFSDGESTSVPLKPMRNNNNSSNRASIENERLDSKMPETGDEDQIWAERRQKQKGEIEQAVARARQRKEEEQRRQRESVSSQKDSRDSRSDQIDRDRGDNRDRERDGDLRDRDRVDLRDRDRDRLDNRDRLDREKDRMDSREKERGDLRDRDARDKDRFDSKDNRDRDRERDRGRDSRDRLDNDKERDRDRNDNRDRERDRFDNRDRERMDPRDRDFRERDRDRDRDYNRDYSYPKNQSQVPPRFLKQQQRAADEHKGWAFPKQPPRRNEPQYAPPPARHAPHNGRRSYSRDVSDREDDFRREKDASGPQWRSEMQDFDRPRELDRSNSKESYKDYEYKGRRSDSEKKMSEAEHNSRTAADKLSEVFERKSIGIAEPLFATVVPAPPAPAPECRATPPAAERRASPPADPKPRSPAPAAGPASWADVAQEENNQLAARAAEAVSPSAPEPATTLPAPPVPQTSSQPNNQRLTPPLDRSLPDSQPAIKPNDLSGPNGPSETSAVPHRKRTPEPNGEPNGSKSGGPPPGKETPDNEIVANKATRDAGKPAESILGEPPAPAAEVKRADDKRSERAPSEPPIKLPPKEPVERKSSGSGSEKKGRGYSAAPPAPYNNNNSNNNYPRGTWPARRPRGARPDRASDSDDTSDVPTADRRRRPRRQPPAEPTPVQSAAPPPQQQPPGREPFAPRGQPSRRGRGGFHQAPRAPAPAKRLAGYGPPRGKSPFSQAARADPSPAASAKPRGGPARAPRDRRARLPPEDDNWETTSEHSDAAPTGPRRRQRPPPRAQPPPRQQQRNQPAKKDGDGKTVDLAESLGDLKITAKKDDEPVDDGFQEVRNKKNSKDTRGSSKEEVPAGGKPSRSRSDQGGPRNQSASRGADKVARGAAPGPKQAAQYERPRQSNLPPRFAKQRQKQQLAGVPDTGAAPPPPPTNAWDKPIAPALRPAPDPSPPEPAVPTAATPAEPHQEAKATPPPASVVSSPAPHAAHPPTNDKTGVLDGSTPPVETIIFENTNYKTTPPADALKPKYQPAAPPPTKPAAEEHAPEPENRAPAFNGDVRPRPRSIQELIGDNARPADGEALGLPLAFDAPAKPEDSSDMKLDFAFDSDLGQLEDKAGKGLGLARAAHLAPAGISPLAADLNLKIASVKKVWEMPGVAEAPEELQFAGFEDGAAEAGAPPNVCKVKPTQQLQSPPPPHYGVNVNYGAGYGPLSVPSPPAALFPSPALLGGSQGGLYGFLEQGRGQFGGFPAAPYAAPSTIYNNYPPAHHDMFPTLPAQYRMGPAGGGGAAFGQSSQLAGNNPSTVLISSSANSLMSATVKPSSQQMPAIDNRLYSGSKGGPGLGPGLGPGPGVGPGGGGGNAGPGHNFGQQFVGYTGGPGPGDYLLGRAAPGNSYYAPYQPTPAPAPPYPLQYSTPQQNQFQNQLFNTQLQVMQQMQQQQYRGSLGSQFGLGRVASQGKSPLHEHNNVAREPASPTPPKHKHKPAMDLHHQNANMNRGGGGNSRGGAPRYPAPIQRPVAPVYRCGAPPRAARPPLYHHPRPGGNGCDTGCAGDAAGAGAGDDAPSAADGPPPAEVKAD